MMTRRERVGVLIGGTVPGVIAVVLTVSWPLGRSLAAVAPCVAVGAILGGIAAWASTPGEAVVAPEDARAFVPLAMRGSTALMAAVTAVPADHPERFWLETQTWTNPADG